MRFILSILIWLSLCLPASAFWVDENFFLSDADLSGTTYYLGYRTSQGAWYIKAMDRTNTDQFRVTYSYVSENTDYSHHWTNRDTLSGTSSYRAFDEAF